MNIDNHHNNDQELVNTIGDYVRSKRLLKNISQLELANLSKVSMASITRFETGKGNISLHNLLAIFNALGITKEIKDFFMARNGFSKNNQARVRWSKKTLTMDQ